MERTIPLNAKSKLAYRMIGMASRSETETRPNDLYNDEMDL